MKKSLSFLLPLAVFTLLAQQASAITPSNRDLYLQLGTQIGAGRTSLSSGNTTIYGNWKLTGGLNIGTGLPITRTFVLTLNGYWFGRYNKMSENNSEFFNNLDLFCGTDIYFYKGFVFGAQLGFSYYLYDTYQNVGSSSVKTSDSGPGWGLDLGIGYELRFSRSVNGGFRLFYHHTFYYPGNSSLSSANLGVGFYARWH